MHQPHLLMLSIKGIHHVLCMAVCTCSFGKSGCKGSTRPSHMQFKSKFSFRKSWLCVWLVFCNTVSFVGICWVWFNKSLSSSIGACPFNSYAILLLEPQILARLESIMLLNLPIMLFGIACKISLLCSFLCFTYSNYAPKF